MALLLFVFKINFSKNKIRKTIRVSNNLGQYQVNVLSGLICIQTVSKDYQHTAKVATSKKIVKNVLISMNTKILSFPAGIRQQGASKYLLSISICC